MDKQTIEFQTQVQSHLTGKMARNIMEIKNPSGSSHCEQLMSKLTWSIGHFTYALFAQVAGIKTAVSLREKVCTIMNKTYGRCFRSLLCHNNTL